jgi:hypothetical protein
MPPRDQILFDHIFKIIHDDRKLLVKTYKQEFKKRHGKINPFISRKYINKYTPRTFKELIIYNGSG